MKNSIKILFTLLGCSILVFGIITEVDGIGRFAIVVFGVAFSLSGSFMGWKNKEKDK